MKNPFKFSKNEMKMPEERFGAAEEFRESSHIGIVIGILIIFLMLLLAGLYVWGRMLQEQISTEVPQNAERPTAEENNEPESNNAEADVQIMQTMSTSDELSAIEADLYSTDLNTLNSDLPAIDALLRE